MIVGKNFRPNLLLKRFDSVVARLKLPEKWKGGRIERWSQYWQALYSDYRIVTLDVVNVARSKPRKMLTIVSGISATCVAMKYNPNENSFYDELVKARTKLVMVGDGIRNPTSEEHVKYVFSCANTDVLRRMDLVFFSLMWIADYNNDCNIFATQCKYLKPRYLTFHRRIIDFGMFGKWFNIMRKMRDYDINPNEWCNS